MRRVVFTMFGSYGDLYPYLALARELAARGDHPVIASMEVFRKKVEEAGVEFAPVRPHIGHDDTAIVTKLFEHPLGGPEYLLRNVLMPSLRETFEDVSRACAGADALVTHTSTYAAPLVAQARGIPWISSVLSPVAFFSAYDAVVVPPIPVLQPLLARSAVANAVLIALVKAVSRLWARPVTLLRRELGLGSGGHPIFDGLHSPDLVLGLFSRVIAQRRPDWPRNTRVLGFAYYDEEATEMDWALRRFLDDGPAPVVFTLGTAVVHLIGDFYAIASRVARRLGMRAILLVGKDANLSGVELSRDVVAFEYVPYAALFARSSIVVHQGGIGTTAQALRAGKPMAIVPFAYDQPDTAARVCRLGVARSVHKRKLTDETMAAMLRDLRDDPSYATRAREVAAIVAGEHAVREACDAIESFLQTRPVKG